MKLRNSDFKILKSLRNISTNIVCLTELVNYSHSTINDSLGFMRRHGLVVKKRNRTFNGKGTTFIWTITELGKINLDNHENMLKILKKAEVI